MHPMRPMPTGTHAPHAPMQVLHCKLRVHESLQQLMPLAQGATAVGTGLNTWKGGLREGSQLLYRVLGIFWGF